MRLRNMTRYQIYAALYELEEEKRFDIALAGGKIEEDEEPKETKIEDIPWLFDMLKKQKEEQASGER